MYKNAINCFLRSLRVQTGGKQCFWYYFNASNKVLQSIIVVLTLTIHVIKDEGGDCKGILK